MKYPFREKWGQPKRNSLQTLETWPDLIQIGKNLAETIEPKGQIQVSVTFPANSPMIPIPVVREEINNLTGEVRGTINIAAFPREMFQMPPAQNDPSQVAVGEERQLQLRSTPAAQQQLQLRQQKQDDDVQAVQEVGTELLEIQSYFLSLIKRLQHVLDCSKPSEENRQLAIAGKIVPRLDNDTLNALRALKQELLEVEAKIDLELLKYATQCNPQISHSTLQEHKEKIETLLKVLKKDLNANSVRNYLAVASQLQPCDILSQIIGLREEALRTVFEGRSLEAAMHENDTEATLNYLKDVCRYMSVSKDDSAEQVLTEIGFTENRAKYLAEQIRSMPSGGQHYTIPDLAFRFVQDLFQNDLLLTNQLPLYPDRTQSKYEVRGFVRRPKVTKPIKCFNLDDDENLEENLKTFFTESENGAEKPEDFQYWYHGTNNKSASNILATGINNGKGSAKKDFSNESGFYLSDDYKAGANWAGERSKLLGSCRAVLQYKVKKDFWKQHATGLELSTANKTELAKWRNVIRFFRSEEQDIRDENLIKKLDKVPFIKGPMSTDGFWEDNERNNDWPVIKDVAWSQLCLCQQEVSTKFNTYLDKVVFILKPATSSASNNVRCIQQKVKHY
jgi:hypothetical protein